MSNHEINISTNASATSSGLRCNDFVDTTEAESLSTAIDTYYDRSKKVIVEAGRTGIDPLIRTQLGVTVIAASETYIRDITVGLLKICPLVRERCKSQQISIGAFNYYGSDGIGFSIADTISFSNSTRISETVKQLTGQKVHETDPLAVVLHEFAKVCNLRHSIVHACGLLSHHHLEGSEITATQHPTYISFSFRDIEVISTVCHNLVRTLNDELFKKTLNGWINNSILSGDWTSDKDIFTGISNLFISSMDRSKKVIPYHEWLKIRSILNARNQED